MQTTTGTGSGSDDGITNYTYTYKFVFKLTYDAAGNQTQQSYTYNYQYSDGKVANSTSNTSYQFDDKGFALRAVRQYNGVGRDGKTSTSTGTEEYTYENDRLIKAVVQSTDNGKVINYSYQYEYDDNGRVTKYSNTYNNSSTKIEYSGNKVLKITNTDALGNTSSPFLEYNEQGLLTKAIEIDGGYSDEYHYEYDSDGSIIRQERYLNSKPSSAYIYEYDTKVNPYAYAYARQKGFPDVPSTRPDFLYKHNYTRLTYLAANAAQTAFENSSSSIYTYDYNTHNFPTGYTNKNLDKNGAEVSTSNVTFEYQGCQ